MGIDILKSFIFNLKIHFNLMLWVNSHYTRLAQFCILKKEDSGLTSNIILSKLFILFLSLLKSRIFMDGVLLLFQSSPFA